MKGETAKQWLNRVEIEIQLRASIGELESDSRFELPKELRASRSTYEDALLMAERVKAEQRRREASISETSDAAKSDSFDLVPGDERSWGTLSDAELEQMREGYKVAIDNLWRSQANLAIGCDLSNGLMYESEYEQ